MHKLGVAVVGVGKLGRRHAENVRRAIPNAQLIAVADADEQLASQVAAELEVEHGTVESVLGRKDVHAIVIAAPSKFHAPLTEAGAKAGKHVFCEKPLALTVEEADAALAAVSAARVQLQMGFMRRYDPAYVEARKRIEAGEIGDPVIFKSVGRDKQPPPLSFFENRVNGTLLSDAAIHDFDLVRWLMEDEVVEVQTFAGLVACPELAPANDVDVALVNLRLSRGGVGNVEAFRKANYGYDIRTEVLGTRGALQIGYLRETPLLRLSGEGISNDVVAHWLERFADAYRIELDAFARATLADRPVQPNGEDGRRSLAVAVAAERSHREARPVSIAAEMGAAASPRTR